MNLTRRLGDGPVTASKPATVGRRARHAAPAALGLSAFPLLILAGGASAEPAAGPPEVVVTAKTPAVKVYADKTVYDIGRDLQSQSGSAADVFNNLPSVQVDMDGGVTLRGDPNVVILVDGKPSTQLNGAAGGLGLQAFSARDIDRVEVMTSPPAQYRAEGAAGVINIITRKTRTAGLSGSLTTNVGDRGRYLASGGLDYVAGALRLSASLSARLDQKQRHVSDERTTTDPLTGISTPSTERLNERLHRFTPTLRLGAEDRLGAKTALSAGFSRSGLTGRRYFDEGTDSLAAGAPGPTHVERSSAGHEWSPSESEWGRIDQSLGIAGETFSLALRRDHTKEAEGYAYVNVQTSPPAPNAYDRLGLSVDLLKTTVSVDYVRPLPAEGTLRAGYAFEQDEDGFASKAATLDPATDAFVNNPAVTSAFGYRQEVNALYASAEGRFARLLVEAGVRLEATRAVATEIDLGARSTHAYAGAYPSLHLTYDLGGGARAILALSRRVTRPNPEALNPFVDSQDVHNLRSGNPDLKPQDTNAFEGGYAVDAGGASYGATAYWRVNRDAATDIATVLAPDVVLTSKANLPRSRSGGVELKARRALGPRVDVSVSADAFWSEITALGLGGSGLRDTSGLNLKAALDLRPTDKDALQATLNRTDHRLTPQGVVGPVSTVNFGYRRRLNEDLSLVATLTDAFDGQIQWRRLQTATLLDTYSRLQIGRVVFVGLTYVFGSGRKKPAAFSYDP